MEKVVRLIKNNDPVTCSVERAQFYLDRGFEVIGAEKQKSVSKEIILETSDRQQTITNSIKALITGKTPDNFTESGFLKLSAVKTESGLDDVTVQEKTTAMKDIEADSV